MQYGRRVCFFLQYGGRLHDSSVCHVRNGNDSHSRYFLFLFYRALLRQGLPPAIQRVMLFLVSNIKCAETPTSAAVMESYQIMTCTGCYDSVRDEICKWSR